MKHWQIGIARTLLVSLLAAGTLAPPLGWSQTPLQQVEQQLRAKQQAAAAHLQQLDRLTDPAQLAVEARQQLHLIHDILALLLEYQTLLTAQASRSSAPSGVTLVPSTGAMWDEPKRGAPGGYLRSGGKDPRQSGK